MLACVLFAYAASHIFNNYVDNFIDRLFGIAEGNESDTSDTFSQEISRPDESGSNIGDESIDPNYKGSSKGSLFVLKNEAGEVDTVMLMRRKVDLKNKSILITMIPADTRLYVDGAYQKVRNLLKVRDLEFFRAKIEAIVGVTIDYYFVMDYDDIDTVLDEFDGYTYNIPYDMYLEEIVESDESGDVSGDPMTPDESGGIIVIPEDPTPAEPEVNVIVDLKAGRKKLDADTFRQLTIFRRNDDEAAHTALMQDLFTSLFVQMFSDSNSKELRRDIEKVLPVLDTNYRMSEYDQNVDAILGYSTFVKTTKDYPGTYKKMADGSTQFNPEVEKAISEFRGYR